MESQSPVFLTFNLNQFTEYLLAITWYQEIVAAKREANNTGNALEKYSLRWNRHRKTSSCQVVSIVLEEFASTEREKLAVCGDGIN